MHVFLFDWKLNEINIKIFYILYFIFFAHQTRMPESWVGWASSGGSEVRAAHDTAYNNNARCRWFWFGLWLSLSLSLTSKPPILVPTFVSALSQLTTTMAASSAAPNLEDVPSVDLMSELLRRMKCASKPDKRLILIGIHSLSHSHHKIPVCKVRCFSN